MGARGVIGMVTSIWRYPVKSMQGEEVQRATIAEHGLLGDRAFALVDRATGKVASAKHPGKWGQLLDCHAAFVEEPCPDAPLPPVLITLPDGSTVTSAQSDVDRLLSRWLGRDVILAASVSPSATFEAYVTDERGVAREDEIADAPLSRAVQGGLFNYASIHILTTATLNHLGDLYPAGRFEISRFRPNIVVAPLVPEHGFIENAWIGYTLTIGQGVKLRVIDPCPRCVVPSLRQGELPHDPNILRIVAQHNAATSATAAPGVVLPAVAGVYASVHNGGAISCQDMIVFE